MAGLRIEAPPAPPLPRGGVRLRFGRHDRVVIDRVEYTVVDSGRETVTLARADNADATQTLSRAHIDLVRHAPGWRHDRDFYRPELARARLHAEVDYLGQLPGAEQKEILRKQRWCLEFIRMREAREATKSDDAMERAIGRITSRIGAVDTAHVDAGRRKRAGRATVVHAAPGPKCLRAWIDALVAGNMNPLALRTKHRKCGNRVPRLTAEEYAVLYEFAWRTTTPERPNARHLWRQMSAAIAQRNEARRASGSKPLRVPSYPRLLQEIDRIPAFDLMAGQISVDEAKNYYRAVTVGLSDVVRPLQRVEIDEWTVDLHVLLVMTRVWDTLSEAQKRSVERVRLVLCLAICVATKCVVGMSLARTANSANAIRTLDMIVSDKQDYADAAGATTPWDMCGLPEMFVADAGTSFANHDVRARVVDLGAIFQTTVGGVPFLRGNVERVFRTTNDRFIAEFAGRTFSDIVERGSYDSQGRANLTIDEFALALVRYKIDHYHNHEHEGLGGETPRSAWLRLSEEFGVDPPPDDHLRRIVFGLELSPVLDASGLRVLGIDYQSTELNALFRERGRVPVDVRVDPRNLGAVSAKVGDGWLLIEGPEELYRVTAKDWVAAWDEFRRRNADLARLTRPILDATMAHLARIGKVGRDRINIASGPMTAEEIARHHRRMDVGATFVRDVAAAQARGPRALLDGALKVGGAMSGPPETAAEPLRQAARGRKSRKASGPSEAVPASSGAARKRPPSWKIGERS